MKFPDKICEVGQFSEGYTYAKGDDGKLFLLNDALELCHDEDSMTKAQDRLDGARAHGKLAEPTWKEFEKLIASDVKEFSHIPLHRFDDKKFIKAMKKAVEKWVKKQSNQAVVWAAREMVDAKCAKAEKDLLVLRGQIISQREKRLLGI